MLRGDVERCLIVAPGSLVEQWQDELCAEVRARASRSSRATRSRRPAAATRSPRRPSLIARLDQLSRNEDLQAKLEPTDWDLVVVDEAHKMSAHYFGGEVKKTKRYQLGELLGRVTRHLLLMTATPHTGKEEDFQLFLALLDPDRFEGKPRDGVTHGRRARPDAPDGQGGAAHLRRASRCSPSAAPTPSPTRCPTTRRCSTSEVTEYVREEMNRAERLKAEGEGAAATSSASRSPSCSAGWRPRPRRSTSRSRAAASGWRTASREERIGKRGRRGSASSDRRPDELSRRSTRTRHRRPARRRARGARGGGRRPGLGRAARSPSSRPRSRRSRELEELAEQVRASGTDRKWEELVELLQDTRRDVRRRRRAPEAHHLHRAPRHAQLPRRQAAARCSGGPRPSSRSTAACAARSGARSQEAFTQDPDVLVLVATDAAGEGVNLQRAHLMVNYDLPWNPNRIEQRFGRIHRIGQTEVCHMWNLVADETREGEVFQRLLREARGAAQGARRPGLRRPRRSRSEGKSLRDLLIEAIRYGDAARGQGAARRGRRRNGRRRAARGRPRARARQRRHDRRRRRAHPRRDGAGRGPQAPAALHPRRSSSRRSRCSAARSASASRAASRSPTSRPSSAGATARSGSARRSLRRYERVTFEKELIAVDGRPLAAVRRARPPAARRHRRPRPRALRRAAPPGRGARRRGRRGRRARVLVYLEHAIVDGRTDAAGNRRVVSKRFEFVELDPDGKPASPARRPTSTADRRPPRSSRLLRPVIEGEWVRDDLETQALDYGVELARAPRRGAPPHARPGRPDDRGGAGTAHVTRSSTGTTAPTSSRSRSSPASSPERHELRPGPPARRRARGPAEAAPRRARPSASSPRCRPSSSAARSSSPPACSRRSAGDADRRGRRPRTRDEA